MAFLCLTNVSPNQFTFVRHFPLHNWQSIYFFTSLFYFILFWFSSLVFRQTLASVVKINKNLVLIAEFCRWNSNGKYHLVGVLTILRKPFLSLSTLLEKKHQFLPIMQCVLYFFFKSLSIGLYKLCPAIPLKLEFIQSDSFPQQTSE